MNRLMTIVLAQNLSLLGSRASSMALSFIAYEMTKSASIWTGLLFLHTLPHLLWSLRAGALTDRHCRKRIMMIADGMSAIVTIVTLVLFLGELLTVPLIGVLIFLTSSFSVFHESAQGTLVSTLIPENHRLRANGWVSTTGATTQALAPLVGGALYSWAGLTGAIILDLLTFTIAIVTLALQPLPQVLSTRAIRPASTRETFRNGLRHIRNSPSLGKLLAGFAVANFFLAAFSGLIGPKILAHGNEWQLGQVLSVGSLGMILGGLWVTRQRNSLAPRWQQVYGLLVLSGAIVVIAAFATHWVAFAIIFFAFNFVTPILGSLSSTLWQNETPLSRQGEVFAIRTLIAWLLRPASLLLAGWAIDHWLGIERIDAFFAMLGAATIGAILILWIGNRSSQPRQPERATVPTGYS